MSKVPAVTLGFWITKILATTLGETAGDTMSMTMDLGYLTSSAIFVAAFLVLVIFQIRARRFSAPLYWATIVASTTAGTTMADLVNQPAKVMRIGNMIRQLLEEVRSAPLDEAGRVRLKEIHAASVKELESGLSPELVDELERITLPFSDSEVPSESELRIAQAQLVGWLEGLFHGIQTALVAQQMAAHAQLEQMRRALPPGATPDGQRAPGMYL